MCAHSCGVRRPNALVSRPNVHTSHAPHLASAAPARRGHAQAAARRACATHAHHCNGGAHAYACASMCLAWPHRRIGLQTQCAHRPCSAPRNSRARASTSRRSCGASRPRNVCVRANNCKGGVHGCRCTSCVVWPTQRVGLPTQCANRPCVAPRVSRSPFVDVVQPLPVSVVWNV